MLLCRVVVEHVLFTPHLLDGTTPAPPPDRDFHQSSRGRASSSPFLRRKSVYDHDEDED